MRIRIFDFIGLFESAPDDANIYLFMAVAKYTGLLA